MRVKIAALIVLSFLCVSVSASPLSSVSFSFASDDNHAGPTFRVDTNNIIEARATVDLMVDVNSHDKGGQVTFQSSFHFVGQAVNYQLYPYFGRWLHTWTVEPKIIQFDHITATTPLNPLLLAIKTKGLMLTSVSNTRYAISETLTMQGSELFAPIKFGVGPRVQGIGIPQLAVDYNPDVAFTLTNLQYPNFVGTPNPIMIQVVNGKFQEPFVTEGSFSASADGPNH